ncbi:MAG TPA: S9 family peptidase [Steroidobacteraceae bacterium]|nr:S9 family peptidase [Steroidobacteraceae bacterium]
MTESRTSGRYLAPALVACAAATASQAAELTIDRLFDAPALSGPSLVGLKISPDATRVIYLQGKPDDKDRLDLWEYNLLERRARMLVDSRVVALANEWLSAEELSRRERQRTAALSGILEYSFAPTGRALLFPLDGRLYYYDLAKPAETALMQVAPGQGFATDPAISPHGRYVAYVRDQNLFAYDLAAKIEKTLTRDGAGPIKNGMAEFVAQEEMDRSTGYWWAPDDRHIAFARVDESPVKIWQRFEIEADNVSSFDQRYPAAGGANVLIRLGVSDLATGTVTWIDLGADQDMYLARVNWLPDGKTLAIQRESRDQRRLDLLFANIDTGASRVVLSETSTSWIELNDELSFLTKSPEFIWASARDGYRHLYLYDYDGRLVRRLTAGEWNVDDFRKRAIKGIDESHRVIYFTATEKSPIERHLYRTSLDTRDPRSVVRISREDGLHGITMSHDTRVYVDDFNSRTQPPQVSMRALDGTLITYLIENRLDQQHPDTPYLADNSIPEFGTLVAADGQLLQYRMFKPAHFDATKCYPAIVDVYGGPAVQRVLDDWTGSSFTQILTRAGYVVFQLDNRGSAFRGTAFQAPIHGRLGEVEVADQVQGARWLGSQPYVDPSRIGVWGWSYGGYMTLMLMFKAPEVFRAGVSGAPVTDWLLYDTHYTERYLDRPSDNAAGYDASSVLPYAKDLRGNLLIIHGMADDNVLFLHSTKLFRRLQDLGKPFEVMVYPGAKHGLTRQRDGRHVYATILRFFNQNLKVLAREGVDAARSERPRPREADAARE